jgi:hypothetical protein
MSLLTDSIRTAQSDEYLNFLIEAYFQHYSDVNIWLSIYDTNKRLKFSTTAIDNFFNVNFADNYNHRPTEMQHAKEVMDVLNMQEAMMEHCIQSASSCSHLVFNKFRGLLGAVHVQFDPIFDSQHIVCGVSVRTFDATSVIFGMSHLVETDKPNRYDLTKLSSRQRQVLFLLALGFTQLSISERLGITRGSVSGFIIRICKCFNLEFCSANYLLEKIGKSQIIKSISQPEIVFKPFVIQFESLNTGENKSMEDYK